MPTLTVMVPSSGRSSLRETVDSVAPQLLPGDQLLVDVNCDGDYGNAARRRMMTHAHGHGLLFMDDDDVYLDGALHVIRAALEEAPWQAHVFRMLYRENRFALWEEPELREGNVASQMICVPNVGNLGTWTDRYESDYDFLASTCDNLGDPIWHEDIVCLVHHPTLKEPT